MIPVSKVHIGCTTLTVGAAGAPGTLLISTSAEAGEVQPTGLVTVKLYVPWARPVTVVVTVFPEIFPGLIVQFPAGNPFSTTDPVDTAQLGCTMTPTAGAAGVAG
jgi:hypothetical protein